MCHPGAGNTKSPADFGLGQYVCVCERVWTKEESRGPFFSFISFAHTHTTAPSTTITPEHKLQQIQYIHTRYIRRISSTIIYNNTNDMSCLDDNVASYTIIVLARFFQVGEVMTMHGYERQKRHWIYEANPFFSQNRRYYYTARADVYRETMRKVKKKYLYILYSESKSHIYIQLRTVNGKKIHIMVMRDGKRRRYS